MYHWEWHDGSRQAPREVNESFGIFKMVADILDYDDMLVRVELWDTDGDVRVYARPAPEREPFRRINLDGVEYELVPVETSN